MAQIDINNNGSYVTIRTPYNGEFIAEVKALGGFWDNRQKAWIASTSKESEVNTLVQRYFSEELRQQEQAERPASTIMRYKDQVLYNVRSVLWNVKERGGTAPTKFWQSEALRLKGEWGTDVANIARQAMGREGLIFEGRAMPDEMAVLVEAARRDNEALLREIAALRAAAKEAK